MTISQSVSTILLIVKKQFDNLLKTDYHLIEHMFIELKFNQYFKDGVIMMGKKVLIIGAGLAGLSAGIHLQKQGIKTEIFEISGQAGGMCTAWERKGYRFDGCIHWMVGTKHNSSIYRLYRDVDTLSEDTTIYNSESIETEINGVMYKIPLKFEEFQEFLLSVSPQDSSIIQEFCKNIAIMMSNDMPLGMPTGPIAMIKFLKNNKGFISLAGKYTGISVGNYFSEVQTPLLKSILFSLMPEKYSSFALIMMLANRMNGNAGYPLGGAHDVIYRMEKLYRELGGDIHFSSKVDQIVVEDGKITALEAKGQRYSADSVIGACGLYDLLKNMLGGKYKHKQLDQLLENAPLFEPIAVVSFGLKQKFNIPFSQTYECPEGIETAPGYFNYRLNLHSLEFDISSAPQDCSSVMIILQTNLDYWQNLRKQNITEYNKKKQELALQVSSAIDKRIPGFSGAIEVTDVATPATYIRYANLYKASWEGFEPTPDIIRTNITKKVDGIKGLHLCGQWTTIGGGICTAVQSGKEAAAAVIKEL